MLPELLRGTLASLDSCRLEGERSTGRQLHHFERGAAHDGVGIAHGTNTSA
jgi:hypothetical protein